MPPLDATVGEEILPFALHIGMLDAQSGRVIPPEILAELGEGDPVAGRKVLRKFMELVRQRGKHETHSAIE